ncbi:MAG: hypothetical protein AB1758_32250, partial [Candidatus Eremiobacterota bacterium]
MIEGLARMEREFRARIRAAESVEELEQLQRRLFGRRGWMTAALRELGSLPPERRPEAGRLANQIKEKLRQALQDRQAMLRRQGLEVRLEAEALDVTLPGRPVTPGRLHPLRELAALTGTWLASLGFGASRLEGPPACLNGPSGRRWGERVVSTREGSPWGGWGHCEGLTEAPVDPEWGHECLVVSLESGWSLPRLRGLLEAWGRLLLPGVSRRFVPLPCAWGRPAFQFLGSYRAGWLGVASAALLPGDAGAIASLGLERATAVAAG